MRLLGHGVGSGKLCGQANPVFSRIRGFLNHSMEKVGV